MREALALVLIVSMASLSGAAAQATAAPPWMRTDFTFTSFDGTELAASVWVPKDTAPTPAVLVTNGWNNRHDMATELRFAERYANQGYVVLAWTSRGWGNSGGDVELDGPKEQNDTRAMIDLLVANKEKWHVMMDPEGPCSSVRIYPVEGVAPPPPCPNRSTTDPRVGMLGESYAGGIQFLTAQGDPRIDSIIPRITWSNLLFALAPHDVLKIGWVSELYATGMTVSRGAPITGHPGDPDGGGASPKLSQWYAESSAMNGPTEEMRHELGWVRSLHPGRLTTPTLLIQGWGDTLFPPDQALATLADLRARNVTARLIFYPGGHGQSLADDDAASIFVDRQMDDWFNVTLRGQAPSLPPYPVLRFRPLEKDYVGELQWPPTGSTMWRGYLGAAGNDGLTPEPPKAAASRELVNPVFPATCVDVPSFQTQAGSNCPYTTPEASAIWAGPALSEAQEVTGTPVAHLVLTSTQPGDVRLFLTLVDVDEAGKAVPVWRQTMPVRLPGASGAPADVAMQPISHTFAKGHRVGLQIATTDLGFYASREPGRVTVTSAPATPSWIDIPTVPNDAWGDDHPPALRVLDSGSTLVVTDDLGVAMVTLTPANITLREVQCPAPNGGLTCQTYAGGTSIRSRMFAFSSPHNATLTATATDYLGNHANLTWSVHATELPVAGTETATDSGQETPGIATGTLIVALALLVVRRRRR